MDEVKFWEIVDFIDWKELCKIRRLNVSSINVKVARQYPFEVIQEFRSLCSRKKNQIAEIIDAQAKLGASVPTGGDSFGDLCAHVVGMGKEYFEDIVANPEKIASVPYQECFSYCVPFKDTYEKLEPDYVTNKVNELRERIIGAYRKDPILSKMGKEIAKIEDIINLAEKQEYDNLPEQADCEIAFEAFNIKLKHVRSTMSELETAQGLVRSNCWYFINNITDIRALSSEHLLTM